MPANRYATFLVVAVCGLAADLWTKHATFAWPALQQPGSVYWLWPEYVGLQASLNEGALFGLGQGQQLLFSLFSIGAAVAIPVWLFAYRAAQDWWFTVTLGGVMAGVLGNLYDRLGLPGLTWSWPPERVGDPVFAVRDWILLQYDNTLQWPNFNLADAFLVVGAATLFFRSLRTPPTAPLPSAVGDSATASTPASSD